MLGELTAWSAHRTVGCSCGRRRRTSCSGQLDRTFPGLTLALPDVLATKVGRLVAAEFADPARLAALGATRFIRFAAHPRPADPQRRWRTGWSRPPVTRCRRADAAVARAVLAADLALLADLDAQIDAATDQLARLLPVSPFARPADRPGLGHRSGPATTAPRSATRPGWPRRRAGLPHRGSQPDPVRVGRQAPRQRDQPRGQRRAAPRPDRPRRRACGSTTPPPRSTPPACVPAARRAWSSPARWPTAPTGSPSRWSATRATYDPTQVDSRRTDPTPSQLRSSSARLEGTKDPDQTPTPLWQTPQGVMPRLAWRPGPSPSRQPERSQMTRHRARSHTSAWAPGTPTASTCRPRAPSTSSAPRSR